MWEMRILKKLLQPKYIVKQIFLYILVMLHHYTRYPHENRLIFFYWPEGICVDMLVVIGIFVMLFWVFCDQYRACIEVLGDESAGEKLSE